MTEAPAAVPREPCAGGLSACVPDDLFLAIDNGGSKCDCVIARGDGTVVAWGGYRQPGLSGRSAHVIGTAVREALAGIPPEQRFFNLCILSPEPVLTAFPFRPNTLSARLASYFNHIFEKSLEDAEQRIRWVSGNTEQESALTLHGLREGIVALSGTGAFVHLLLPSRGIDRHLDGFGPVLGDHGGAYQIGQRAFRAAAAAHWSPRRATSLREPVFAALNLQTVNDAIGLSLLNPDRSLLASLARVVETEAEKGDAIARAILLDASADLSETVYDALSAADLFDADLPLVGTGSIATRCALYWRNFCERVHAFAPNLRPLANPRPAVLGVLAQGIMRRFDLDDPALHTLVHTINRSYDAFSTNQSDTKGAPCFKTST